MRLTALSVLLSVPAIVSAVELKQPESSEIEVVSASQHVVPDGLDLSTVWECADMSEIPVSYSGTGWGVDSARPESGVVSLLLSLKSGGTESAVASGLADGDGTYMWDPDGVLKSVYVLRHEVSVGGTVDKAQGLQAEFSFEHAKSGKKPSDAAVAKALFGGPPDDGVTFSNDPDLWWDIDRETGVGIVAQEGQSEFSFTCMAGHDHGCEFSLSYRLAGASLSVWIDGEMVSELSAAGQWKRTTFVISGPGEHSVVFKADVAGGGTACLSAVKWAQNRVFARSVSRAVAVDFREGVRVLGSKAELMPFVYSATNFTGLAVSVEKPVAKVSIVRLQGDGEDLEAWTPVAGTNRVLKRASDDGEVIWSGKRGVFRATFEIDDGDDSVHFETVIFDLRNIPRTGLILTVR